MLERLENQFKRLLDLSLYISLCIYLYISLYICCTDGDESGEAVWSGWMMERLEDGFKRLLDLLLNISLCIYLYISTSAVQTGMRVERQCGADGCWSGWRTGSSGSST